MAVPIITSVDNALSCNLAFAFRSLPAPISEIDDAPPIPRSSAAAVEIVVTGNAILVAAFPEHADTLTDKNLVYYIIESIDQHADDSWDCKI